MYMIQCKRQNYLELLHYRNYKEMTITDFLEIVLLLRSFR